MRKCGIVLVCTVAFVCVGMMLWFSGILPKQVAKWSGEYYVREHFPKMQLQYSGIEWSKHHGAYLITFRSNNQKTYCCTIGSRYLPVIMGQGLQGFGEE